MSPQVGLPLAFGVFPVLSAACVWFVVRVTNPARLSSLFGGDSKAIRSRALALIMLGGLLALSGASVSDSASPRSLLAWLVVPLVMATIVLPGVWITLRWARGVFGEEWWSSVRLTGAPALPPGSSSSRLSFAIRMIGVFILGAVAAKIAIDHVVF